MSRAISRRRKRLRISCTTVELRVARAIARWNLRSFSRKSSAFASARLRSISADIAAKSSSLACTAASWATRGSSRRRASSTPATSLTRIAWRLLSRSRGTSSDATKMPPDCPRRTARTPASARTFTASRRVGRLIRIWAASSRSDGSRSPTCRSPALMRSAICSTASSKVRRDETASNELSKPTSGYPATAPATSRLSVAGGGHALERLALGHLDRRRGLGLGGLEGELEALHRPRDQLGLARPAIPVPLSRDMDQAAAVGEEVGDVEDVALHQDAR